jgi:O-antigen ligase
VGLLGVVGGIRVVRVAREKKYELPILAKPMLVFLGIAAFSLVVNIPLLSGREVVVAGLYWLRLLAYFGLYLGVNLANWSNWSDLLLASGTMVAIFGLVQYFLWPDMSALTAFGWDPHYYRLVGTFLDPNFTGIILVLTIILLTANFRKKPIYYLLFTICYLALALTYSRASWLAFLAGTTVLFLVKRIKKKMGLIIFIIFIMMITVIILPRKPGGEGVKLERIASVQSRLGSWRQALVIAKDHPFFGIGFNAYRYAQKRYGLADEEGQVSHAGAGADSSFLFVLATTGIIGLTVYLWLWLEIIKLAWKKRNSAGGLAVLGSVGALLVHSCFNNSLFYTVWFPALSVATILILFSPLDKFKE